MGFFFEPINNPQQNNANDNEVVKNEADIKLLNDIDIIHRTTFLVGTIYPDEILVTRNIFGQNTKKVTVKGPGFHGKAPLIKEAYIIDTNDIIVEVNDTKSEDGRYNQSIGIGEDIKISLRITLKASDEPRYAAKLVKQQNSYKAAIRKASERIMRLLINEKLLVKDLAQEDVLDVLSNVTSRGLGMDPERDLSTPNLSDNYQEILEISTKLLTDYGLILMDVTFTDIDISQNLKNKISERISQQNEFKMQRQKAETDVYVAEQNAEATRKARTTEIEMLLKMKEDLKLTDAQMTDILKWGKLPQNAIAVVGRENSNIADFMAASMINSNQQEQVEKGKTK